MELHCEFDAQFDCANVATMCLYWPDARHNFCESHGTMILQICEKLNVPRVKMAHLAPRPDGPKHIGLRERGRA